MLENGLAIGFDFELSKLESALKIVRIPCWHLIIIFSCRSSFKLILEMQRGDRTKTCVLKLEPPLSMHSSFSSVSTINQAIAVVIASVLCLPVF